jgi:hypothetical protein
VAQLFADTKYHLYQYGCYDFWKLPLTPDEKKADKNRLKRQTLVKCLVDALKPDNFREAIELKVRNDPDYKYDHLKLEELILLEGEKWEHVYKQKKATQKDKLLQKEKGKPSEKEHSRKEVTVEAKAKMVTHKGAQCINCKESGHYFLTKDKQTNQYIQNCPKDAGKNFDNLKKQSLKQMDEAKSKRKERKKANASKKKSEEKTPAPAKAATNGEGWQTPMKELSDTMANVVSAVNELIAARKSEINQEKERADSRFKLMSMRD